MKRQIRLFTTVMVCMAMALCVSCKKDDDSSDSGGGNGGGGNTGGSTLTEEGIYLGVIGFNDNLYTKDISLLNNSTKYEFKTFISDLTTANGTGLYYADYKALENLKSSQEPPKLTNVVLVTFTDGLDNVSIGPSFPNPGNYNTDEEYRNALHDKIKNDIVHGKHINAYTIGLKGLDAQADIETFRANLKKLASDDNNVYEAENMNEALESFAEIAESLHSVSTNSKLMLKVPGGYNSGSLIRFTFDNITAVENSNLYVEGIYTKNSSGLLVENITYHGFKDGATSLASVGVDGSYYQIVFENLTKTNGELLTQNDINNIKLWQKKSAGWVPETEFTPNGSTQVIDEQSSALIMLVLDCTTSLGPDFNNMKTAAKQFVETLISNNSGNATTAPTVTTSSVSDVTTSSAKCGGYVTSDGGAMVKACGVCWSTSPDPTVSNSHTTDGSGTGSFTSSITGLAENTTYYVRAYATNRKDTSYGEQRNFTTQSVCAPTVTTSSVSNITLTTATCGGNVKSDGGATVTERGVCWSTEPNPTLSDNHTVDGEGMNMYTSEMMGLEPGTKYYVRAYAKNAVGMMGFGEQKSFTTQSTNGHEYVDLGLPSGLLWATCNVGADSPEDYGNYYAWGETTTKNLYRWTTYKWYNSSNNTLTKYNTNSDFGIVDNRTVLEPADDVAHVKWGGAWRMPTDDEMIELKNNCTWIWTTQGDRNGYRVTGSNGKSIFLPTAGHYNDDIIGGGLLDVGSRGSYWSSSLNLISIGDLSGPFNAESLSFNSGNVSLHGSFSNRCYGYSVRPVFPSQK